VQNVIRPRKDEGLADAETGIIVSIEADAGAGCQGLIRRRADSQIAVINDGLGYLVAVGRIDAQSGMRGEKCQYGYSGK